MFRFSRSICRFGGTIYLLSSVLLPCASVAPAEQWPTVANPPWSPGVPLTLEHATSRALACDPRILTLKAAVEVAREERLAATDLKDPMAKAESRTIGRPGTLDDGDLDDSRISLGVYVPNPWLMVPRVSARTADYRAAEADLNAATWLVRCDLRQLFAQLNYLTNDLLLTADRVRLSGEVLKATQAQVQQGAAAATDLMTASRQYLQFQNDFDQASHNYQLARQQLASLLNVAPGSFALATNAVLLAPLPQPGLDFEEAYARAFESRWDLVALRWRAVAAVSYYHEVRNQRVPWVKEVEGGYINDASRNSGGYWAGIAADIPIFSWTINHGADAALAKVELAGVSETNGFRLVGQQLHDALDEVDLTHGQVVRNDSTMTPLMTTMRQTVATLKATPNVMPEQVAAAELELVETLRFELNTRWQYEQAVLNLERVLGQSYPESVITPAP